MVRILHLTLTSHLHLSLAQMLNKLQVYLAVQQLLQKPQGALYRYNKMMRFTPFTVECWMLMCCRKKSLPCVVFIHCYPLKIIILPFFAYQPCPSFQNWQWCATDPFRCSAQPRCQKYLQRSRKLDQSQQKAISQQISVKRYHHKTSSVAISTKNVTTPNQNN